jgi:protein phosphatase
MAEEARGATEATHAARSDVGRVRAGNEDRWLARPPLFVVADGMGGHAAGEVAAQLAVDAFAALSDARVGPFTAEVLAGAIQDADDAIHRRASDDPAVAGMGTTCTALAVEGSTAHLAHVGDSRAYLLRAGRLTQLTEDHTLVAALVHDGVLSAEAATTDDRRHVILRALGVGDAASADRLDVALRPGDRLLLCSDGLTGHLDGPALADALGPGTPAEAADRLVALAIDAGGEDNVTVIVIDPLGVPGAGEPVDAAAVETVLAPTPERGRGRRRGRSVGGIAIALLAVVFAIGLVVAGGFLGGPAPSASPSVAPSVPAPTPSALPSVSPSSLPPASASPSITPSPSASPAVSPSPTPSSA